MHLRWCLKADICINKWPFNCFQNFFKISVTKLSLYVLFSTNAQAYFKNFSFNMSCQKHKISFTCLYRLVEESSIMFLNTSLKFAKIVAHRSSFLSATSACNIIFNSSICFNTFIYWSVHCKMFNCVRCSFTVFRTSSVSFKYSSI